MGSRKLLLLCEFAIIMIVGYVIIWSSSTYAASVSCSGRRSTSGFYIYNWYCNLNCSNGWYGSVSYQALEVPNKFHIADGNSSRVWYSTQSGPWGYNWVSVSANGSFNFNTTDSIGQLTVETVAPSNQDDEWSATVNYTCYPSPPACQPVRTTYQNSCNGNNIQYLQSNNCDSSTRTLAWPNCPNWCSNGSCNWCGTANGATEYQCNGNGNMIQQRSFVNNGNQCSRWGWSDIENCPAWCSNGSCNNPPPTHIQYKCQIAWRWAYDGTCNNLNYNPSTTYYGNNVVCSSYQPNNVTCFTSPWASCGGNPWTCNEGSSSNDNYNNSCGQSRSWTCSNNVNSVSCNRYNGNCTAVDCEVGGRGGRWWCDRQCNWGTQRRYRLVTVPAQNNWSCNISLSESQSCNNQACIVASNCQVGNRWWRWGCNRACGWGNQKRYRSVIVPAQNNWSCNDSLEESQSCNTQPCTFDRNCEVGGRWSRSSCDRSCWWGTQHRDRSVTVSQAWNWLSCPNLRESQSCNTDSCTRNVNCVVSNRSWWGACNRWCGWWTQTQTRTIITPQEWNGAACPTPLTMEQWCNPQACTRDVDCVLSGRWPLSACSRPLGGWTQTQSRTVITPQEWNGAACSSLIQELPCGSNPTNGQCNQQQDRWCTVGNVANQSQNGNTKTRTCRSPNGGQDANCQKSDIPLTYSCSFVSCNLRLDGGWQYTNPVCDGQCTPRCGNGRIESGEQCDNWWANSNTCSAQQCWSCGWCNNACQNFTQTNNSRTDSVRDISCLTNKTYGYRQIISCVDGYFTASCPFGQRCNPWPKANLSQACISCPAAGQQSNFRCGSTTAIAHDQTDGNCSSFTTNTPCPYLYKCSMAWSTPSCTCAPQIDVKFNYCNASTAAWCNSTTREHGRYHLFGLYNASGTVLIATGIDEWFNVKFNGVSANTNYIVRVLDIGSGRVAGNRYLQRDYATIKTAIVTTTSILSNSMMVRTSTCTVDARMDYFCPSGNCSRKNQIIVQVGRDVNGNNMMDNGENTWVPAIVSVSRRQWASRVLNQTFRTKLTGNWCPRNPNDDGSLPPYNPSFVFQWCQGTTEVPIIVDGSWQYRIQVSPEQWFQSSFKNLHQRDGTGRRFVSLTDTALSTLANTVEFTMPVRERVVAVFGNVGVNNDLGLTTRIASAPLGYMSGDIVNIEYTVANRGFGTVRELSVTTAVLTWLEFIPWSQVYSGNCGQNSFIGWEFIGTVQVPTRRNRRGSQWVVWWHDYNDCDPTASEPRQWASCRVPYFNSMLFTWRSVINNPNPGCSYPYHETRVEPNNPFPNSASELSLWAWPSFGQSAENCYWYPTQWYSVQFRNAWHPSVPSSVIANGQSCVVRFSYRVTSNVVGSTIRARACLAPSEDEIQQFNRNDAFGNPNPNRAPAINNCSDIMVPIGFTHDRYQCNSGSWQWTTVATGMSTTQWLLYPLIQPFPSTYLHGAQVFRPSGSAKPADITCALYPPSQSRCSTTFAYNCDGWLVWNINTWSMTRTCTSITSGALSCQLYNYFTCNSSWNWNLHSTWNLITWWLALYNPSAWADFYKPNSWFNSMVYANPTVSALDTLTCASAQDSSCGVVRWTCNIWTVTWDNLNMTCGSLRQWSCNWLNNGRTAICSTINQCPTCGSQGACSAGSTASNYNWITACGLTWSWTCTNTVTNLATSCIKSNWDCALCNTQVAGGCFAGITTDLTGSVACGMSKTRSCRSILSPLPRISYCMRPNGACISEDGICGQNFATCGDGLGAWVTAVNTGAQTWTCLWRNLWSPTQCSVFQDIQCTPLISVRQNIGLLRCGDAVLQVGEQCDDGNNTSLPKYNHNWSWPTYIEAWILNGNSCSLTCSYNKSLPRSCYYELPACNSNSVQSIQEGEIYPFWWNIVSASSTGVTTQCVGPADSGKVIINPSNTPQCTFGVYNSLAWRTVNDALLSFTVPCFSSAITTNTFKNKPIFDSRKASITNAEAMLLRGNQLLNVNDLTGNQLWDVGINPLNSNNLNSLNTFTNNLSWAQWWYAIVMSGFTDGKLGEYRVRLDRMTYNLCRVTTQLDILWNSLPNTVDVLSGTIAQPICQQNFVVTKPYLIQDNGLLSTRPNESFSNFFAYIDGANKTLTTRYGSGVATQVTQIGSYVPSLRGQKFVDEIVNRYVILSSSIRNNTTYTETFQGLSTAIVNQRIYTFKKIPDRQIYIYTWTNALYLSDVWLQNMLGVGNTESVTIIAPSSNVFFYKSLVERNLFVITRRDVGFLWSNMVNWAQRYKGIIISSWYVLPPLKNNDQNTKWIDDGRLIVEGIIMSNDISPLVNNRRSVIKDWYVKEWSSDIQDHKRKQLIDGASLQIVTNVWIFTSPPPLSQELFQSLAISK